MQIWEGIKLNGGLWLSKWNNSLFLKLIVNFIFFFSSVILEDQVSVSSLVAHYINHEEYKKYLPTVGV